MKRAAFFTVCCLCASSAWADWVEYTPSGIGIRMLIPAKSVKALPGKIYAVTHEVGTLFLKMEDCRVIKKPLMSELYEKMERQALGKKNAEEMMNVARWALQRGLLKQFHSCVDKALELDRNNADAKRVVALREKLNQPIADVSKSREQMQKLVRTPGMKFKSSNHYLLMYNTADEPAEKTRKKARHDERIELLERVYETFMYKFYAQGVDLEIPKQPLKVVLFKDFKEYTAFGSRLGDTIRFTAGFYEHTMNTAFFFDQGTHDSFKALKKLDEELQGLKKKKLGGDIARLADSIHALVFIEQESQDIEVVSHEATHQIAANSGLLPRHVMIPSWVHEGLATYFESPNDATWAGFGAVNEQRVKYYRALERDREHSNIDFIVGNQIFDYARGGGAILHGYAQAWALTHFLMDKHFDRFIAYYRKLGEMPPDVPLSAEVLTKLFNEVFGESRSQLDGEWRAYMADLKTDRELYLKE